VKVSVDDPTFVQGLERVAERTAGEEHVFLFTGCLLV
jgi:hypothetical protein